MCVWCGGREGGGGWYVCGVCGVRVVCGWCVANQLLVLVVPSNVSPQGAHDDESQDS